MKETMIGAAIGIGFVSREFTGRTVKEILIILLVFGMIGAFIGLSSKWISINR